MLKGISAVADNQYGRKVLLYLLNPRDPHHFHPDIVRILQEGDNSVTRWVLIGSNLYTLRDTLYDWFMS